MQYKHRYPLVFKSRHLKMHVVCTIEAPKLQCTTGRVQEKSESLHQPRETGPVWQKSTMSLGRTLQTRNKQKRKAISLLPFPSETFHLSWGKMSLLSLNLAKSTITGAIHIYQVPARVSQCSSDIHRNCC